MDVNRLKKLAGLQEDDEVESSWTPSGEVWSLWASFPYEGKFLCGLYSSKDLAKQAWDEMVESPRLEKNGSLSLEALPIDDSPNLRYF